MLWEIPKITTFTTAPFTVLLLLTNTLWSPGKCRENHLVSSPASPNLIDYRLDIKDDSGNIIILQEDEGGGERNQSERGGGGWINRFSVISQSGRAAKVSTALIRSSLSSSSSSSSASPTKSQPPCLLPNQISSVLFCVFLPSLPPLRLKSSNTFCLLIWPLLTWGCSLGNFKLSAQI